MLIQDCAGRTMLPARPMTSLSARQSHRIMSWPSVVALVGTSRWRTIFGIDWKISVTPRVCLSASSASARKIDTPAFPLLAPFELPLWKRGMRARARYRPARWPRVTLFTRRGQLNQRQSRLGGLALGRVQQVGRSPCWNSLASKANMECRERPALCQSRQPARTECSGRPAQRLTSASTGQPSSRFHYGRRA